MKKYSVWILFLSALLCLSMLLSACSPSGNDGTEPEETTATTKEPVPVDVPVDYASILAKWGAQLEPLADEAAVDSQLMFRQNRLDETNPTYVTPTGCFYVVTRVYSHATYARTYQVYSMKTGEKIFEQGVRANGMGVTPYLSIRALGAGSAIFEVEERTGLVSTYTYFDATGKALVSHLKEQDYKIDEVGDTTYVTLVDKVYACRDGEILCTFDKGSEFLIPKYDFEYNGFFYKVEYAYNDFLEESQVSRVVVMDRYYNLYVDYVVDSSYDSVEFWVLNNGDLFFQYDYFLSAKENSSDYEVPAWDTEGRLRQEIVNANTGAVTAVKTSFRVAELYTKQNVEELGLSLKGDMQIAVIERITDGKLNPKCEFVLVDNALTAGETLPVIVQNQQKIEKRLDADSYLISALNYDGTLTLYYSVNTAQNTVSLYVNDNVTDEADNPLYQPVKGGFVSEDILYNNALEEIYDLRNADSYRIYADFLLVKKDETCTLCYIKDGKATTRTVNGYILSDGSLIPTSESLETVDVIYNTEGKELISGSNLIPTLYEDYAIVKRNTTSYSEYYILK